MKGFTVNGVVTCLLELTLEVCLPSWPEGHELPGGNCSTRSQVVSPSILPAGTN